MYFTMSPYSILTVCIYFILNSIQMLYKCRTHFNKTDSCDPGRGTPEGALLSGSTRFTIMQDTSLSLLVYELFAFRYLFFSCKLYVRDGSEHFGSREEVAIGKPFVWVYIVLTVIFDCKRK